MVIYSTPNTLYIGLAARYSGTESEFSPLHPCRLLIRVSLPQPTHKSKTGRFIHTYKDNEMTKHAQVPFDSLRQLYGTDSSDCCVICSREISSKRQIANPGTDVCESCSCNSDSEK